MSQDASVDVSGCGDKAAGNRYRPAQCPGSLFFALPRCALLFPTGAGGGRIEATSPPSTTVSSGL